MKIKLVAIAKDEAAYLSEWIYHHLHFGFDSIDVYTNNISDNTKDVLRKISENYDVTDVDADFILGCSSQGFQRMAYGIALQKAKLDGFSHFMFLDIDEFWTPKDFNTNIEKFLVNLNDPDVVVFPWALKVDTKEFSMPFDDGGRYIIYPQIKTILKTSVNVKTIHEHSIVSKSSISILPDGRLHADLGKYVPKMEEAYQEIPSAFISHRICRSPMEFVSLLGRGRPNNSASMSSLKDNRPRFIRPKKTDYIFQINGHDLSTYIDGFIFFIESCSLEKDVELGREFVKSRYADVIARMKLLDCDESKKFIRLLKGVELSEVKDVLDALEQKNTTRSSSVSVSPEFESLKNPVYVNDKVIEFLRDEALNVEKNDLELSLSLMSLALEFRPHGPVIKAKVLELQEKLK